MLNTGKLSHGSGEMHETGSSSKNSLDNFICSVAEQSFCHLGVLLGAPRTGFAPAEKHVLSVQSILFDSSYFYNIQTSAIKQTNLHIRDPSCFDCSRARNCKGALVEVESLCSQFINLILVQTFII